MFLQIACLNRCKITLVAFVWFFARESFHVSPKIADKKENIVTLIAFVCFFPPEWFFLCFPCPNRGIVTLVAFVNFHMFPQISSNLLKSLHIGSHCLSSYFLPLKAAWASVHYFDNSNTDNLLSKIHFPWTYSSLSRWTDICGNMMCGYLWECNSPMTPLQTICLIVISPIILAVITHHYHH